MKNFGKAVADGKLNYQQGILLEREFALSPRVLNDFGLLLPATKVQKNGEVTTVADLLVGDCSDMVDFNGVPTPLTKVSQGGNVVGVDFLTRKGQWVNIKALVDDATVVDQRKTLKDRASHSVEVAKGVGYQVARHLIVNKKYEMILLVPYGTDRYIVAQFDYSEYHRRCSKQNAYCVYASGHDKCLLAMGIGSIGSTENYGIFRRLKNEKHKLRGKKKNLLTLEVSPFSASFQSIYPYMEWTVPPKMYEYTQGVFIHRPDEKVPY